MRSAVLLLSILSGVMWGSAGVFVRTLSDAGMDQVTIVFTRMPLAVLMVLAVILLIDRRMLRLEVRDLWMFVLCAVSMLALNALYTYSVDEVSLSLAAVLLSLSPLFMLLMARVIFGERITSKKVVCMAVSVVGCVLVSGVFEGDSSLSVQGVVAGLAAAFFYALYGIGSKRATSRGYSSFTTLFYCLLISTIVLLPLSDIGAVADFAGDGAGNILFLVVNAAVTSFLPYMLYTIAMSRTEAGTVSILAACGEPTAAMVFGLLFFTEVPSPLMLVGMVLAIGAMAVMCMPHKGDAGGNASGTG